MQKKIPQLIDETEHRLHGSGFPCGTWFRGHIDVGIWSIRLDGQQALNGMQPPLRLMVGQDGEVIVFEIRYHFSMPHTIAKHSSLSRDRRMWCCIRPVTSCKSLTLQARYLKRISVVLPPSVVWLRKRRWLNHFIIQQNGGDRRIY